MHKDLVEQVTATIGTGSYVVSGAVAGRRSFADAYVDGDTYVPYVVTDDVGGYEAGLGTWTEGTLTLARTVVLNSSNAGAAVAWAAGDKRIYATSHAQLMFGNSVRHHYAEDAVAPAAANNASQGFGPGSTWMCNSTSGSLTKELWVLDVITGGTTAVWSRVSRETGVDSVQGHRLYARAAGEFNGSSLYSRGALELKAANGAASWNSVTLGGQWDELGGTYNFADAIVSMALGAHTTDATVTYMTDQGTWGDHYIEGNCVVAFNATVTATDGASNRKVWRVDGVVHADAAGAVTIDLNTVTVVFATAGAAAWTVELASRAAYYWNLRVTGAAATDIMWGANLRGSAIGKY